MKAAEKAGYAFTRGRHKMGRVDEHFKTKARAMLAKSALAGWRVDSEIAGFAHDD
jgi:hypothetical protein